MAGNGTRYDTALVAHVVEELARRLGANPAPRLIGLSGLQGSGKSTLARQLVDAAAQRGIHAVELSIDDFYLTRRERGRLAKTVHPLLATRGVPGTHDTGLVAGTLAALHQAEERHPARLPSFDKGRDTRATPSRWRRVATPPDWILLEGWCIGVTAERPAALREPCNALERDSDADGYWRRWVNARLQSDYAALWARFDALAVLQAPDFAVVENWRDQPERELRRRGAPEAMSKTELRRFLMYYERLSRHALRVLPKIADITIAIDRKRRVRRITSAPLRRRR
ncbi:MAG TPA: kinase [Rhodanobacteraceae bacterium]|nr:kinase [Rhodanobacteraceae bacterium]